MKARDLLEEIKENIKDFDIAPFEERAGDENTDQTSKLRANFHRLWHWILMMTAI